MKVLCLEEFLARAASAWFGSLPAFKAATMRRTIEQGAGALMWSVRMIGVALAFLAPWIIALAAALGIVRGIRRSRRHREN